MNIQINEIAGYMSERHVWQLLYELSSILSLGAVAHSVTASSIVWDEQHFSFSDKKDEDADAYRFLAPEVSKGKTSAASQVWALGAVAFYMHMGCHVFNGWGGESQTVASPVPFMRKELKELSETLQRCLSFSPEKRPTLEQLSAVSKAQLHRLQAAGKPRERKAESLGLAQKLSIDDFWPEEMTEK